MYEVVIVGGGVVGLLTAFYLQEEGKEVCVIDQSEIGTESSWAGGGILSPLYPWLYDDAINQLCLYGQNNYQSVSEVLKQSVGIDPQWVCSGMVMLDLDTSQAMQDWQKKYNATLTKITDTQINRYEPNLNPKFTTAWIQENIAQLRNPWLMRSLRQYLQNKGVIFRENREVSAIKYKNNKITGVIANHKIIKAEEVIIASGAWSSLFIELQHIDVKPVMGQMILYKTEPHWLKRIVMKGGKYVIPREDGHILCGSSLEWNGYNKMITRDTKGVLKNAAEEMIPELAQHKIIKQWSGLRPGSPNGVPYIGEHERIKNLYINTGHYRYGVVMGLGSAKLLTDIIIGNSATIVDPSLYALSAKRERTQEYSNLN